MISTKPGAARWVVMGVSGSGKSAVGARLAAALDAPFVEGDAFHPAQNVARMAAGISLTDADRAPWLAELAGRIKAAAEAGTPMVLACSALKRRYRDLLRSGDAGLRFIHLTGDPAVLATRMGQRPGHFMPVSLLESQLRDLEPLGPDEHGIVLDIAATPDEQVAAVLAQA
ncbi:MAG: gluconokinase [Massilia sp.]